MNEKEEQPCFERVLVPVDGSHASLHAEEFAVVLAQDFGSKITVLHVTPRVFMTSAMRGYTQLPSSIRGEITGWFEQRGRKVTAEAQALFEEEGITPEIKLVEYADPAETILRIAKEGDYDLIVIGNRGMGEVQDFSLGAVAEKVSQQAECPVLVVKGKRKISRILVGVDGSEHSRKAFRYATGLASRLNAKITLLNVIQLMGLSMEPDVELQEVEAAKESAMHILSEVAAQEEEFDVEKRVGLGHPAEMILKVAADGDYDMVVVGSRGLSRLTRFFLGSVSERVSKHAECSVLIVK